MRTVLQSLVAAIAIGLVMMTGAADAASSSAMPMLGGTSQPVGHHDFCKRYPQECQPNATVSVVQLTRASWAELNEVNKAVNISIFPRTDEDIYGIAEYWAYPTTEGDCEDYVLLKQYMLERNGFPRSALLITVVRQPNGDGHAVLTVRTDNGDYILDNLEDRILPWIDTSYRYLKRQSERDSSKWVSIGDDRNMLVGSVR